MLKVIGFSAGVIWLALVSLQSKAAELSLGYSLVEEGNDVARPAVTASLGLGVYSLGLTYFGRSFGSVREQTSIVSFTKTLPIARSNFAYVKAGASLVREFTAISGFPGETLTETSYAPAASLGIGIKLLKVGILRSDLSWTTHVIPAGFSGIFLAHGRKQCFTISAGVDL